MKVRAIKLCNVYTFRYDSRQTPYLVLQWWRQGGSGGATAPLSGWSSFAVVVQLSTVENLYVDLYNV